MTRSKRRFGLFGSRSARKTRRSLIERLEDRLMLSVSPEEQEFIYLLNLARHDPARFAQDFALPVDLASVPSRAPLAWSDALSQAATARASEMAQANYFQHQSAVTGKWPNEVVRDRGYPLPSDWPNAANFIESLAAGTFYTTAEQPLKALLTDRDDPSLMHRRHLLGMDEAFADAREIGVGHAENPDSTFGNYWAVEAAPRDGAAVFLTGVAFQDANGNGRYDSAEGLPGITVTAGTHVTQTNEAGGWSLEVVPGVYEIAAAGPALSQSVSTRVRVGQENVEVDFLAGRSRGVVDFTAWRNAVTQEDVNDDGRVTALDALLLINGLNTRGSYALLQTSDAGDPAANFPDVNGDDWVSPADALAVINRLNSTASPTESAPAPSHRALGEGEADADSLPPTLEGTGERLVNTLIPRVQTSEAESTAVATNATGATVVVFSGKGPIDPDGVYARRYDKDGAALADVFRVNTTTREAQKSPAVGVAEDGSFLIAWDGRGPGDQLGVFGQWFDALGQPRGSETRINTTTGGNQQQPAVAVASGGHSVVVWQGLGFGDLDGIFLQRFDANGAPLGSETQVNTYTGGLQAYPSIAMAPNGQFVVTWSSRHQDGSDWGVYGQRFAADGTPLGAEFPVNASIEASQVDSSVAMGDRGEFVVTWSGYATSGTGWNVYAQRFAADGQRQGNELLINARTTGHQKDPSVAMLANGGFLVSWTTGEPDGSGWEAVGRVYAPGREDQADVFPINTVTFGHASGHQQYTATAVGGGPRAIIAWSGRGQPDHGGVFSQIITGDLLGSCLFTADFQGWTIGQSGGSQPANVRVVAQDCEAVMTEGDSFVVTLATDFQVPATPSAVTFTYDQLAFDTRDAAFINDAFEVALVDQDGNSLVKTYTQGRDAYFNVTEGLPAASGDGVQIDDQTVTIGLDRVPAGTAASLIFRLVNNDSDTTTSVRIKDFRLVESELEAAPAGGGSRTLADPTDVLLPTSGSSQVSDSTETTERNEANNIPRAMLDDLTPSVFVRTPADGSTLSPGSTVLVSGAATVRQPEVGGASTTPHNRIIAVLINGTAVDVLDAAGNFFAQVEILPGRNVFDITAIDACGQTAGTTLTVEGTRQPAGTTDLLFDVSPSFTSEYARTSFDEKRDLLYAELAIRNVGQYGVDTPFYVGVRNISDPTVAVRAPAGVTRDGVPYYNFSPVVPGKSLTPSEITGFANAVFHNPDRVQFAYELVFLAKLNEPPVFTSVPAVEIYPGQTYHYDADASDADGDTLRYSLIAGPSTMTIDEGTGQLTWSPTLVDIGTYSISLEVNDGRGGSAAQNYVLSVVEVVGNRPPVITSSPVVVAAIMEPYRYDVDAMDADLDPITYSLTTHPEGMQIDPASGVVTWTPSVFALGDQAVTVQASDGRGGVDEQTFVVRVQSRAGNHPPVIVSHPVTAVVVPASSGATPALYAYDVDAVDPDNDVLAYFLANSPTGMSIDPVTGIVSWNATSGDVGQHAIAVRASDGRGGYDVQTYTLTVSLGGTGEIRGAKFHDVNRNGIWDGSVVARNLIVNGDAEAGPGASNAGMTARPLPGWTPTGTFTAVQWGAQDGFPTVNDPGPTDRGVNFFAGGPDNSFSHAFQVVDVSAMAASIDAGSITFELSGYLGGWDGQDDTARVSLTFKISEESAALPSAWIGPVTRLERQNATGLWYRSTSGTVPPGTRIIEVQLRMTKSHGDYNDGYADNLSLVLHGVSEQEPGLAGWTIYVDQNENGRRDMGEPSTVTNADGSYAFAGLPAGTYVVAEEPIPGWTQTAPATRAYTVTLSDGQVVTGLHFGNVERTGDNSDPELISASPTSANVDQLLRYDAIATDPDNDPLTFDLPLAPAGMTVHPQTGTLVWQPTRDQTGTHQVVLRVQDGRGGIGLQSFSINVASPNTAPVITSTPPGPAIVGFPYVYQVHAQDAERDTISFRLDSAPVGMSIDRQTGNLTWTPTDQQTGNHAVAVVAADIHGAESQQSFTLQVEASAPNDPPAITSQPPLTARVGQTYVYVITAIDPDGDPLRYSLDAGPSGMAINASGVLAWQVPAELLGQKLPVTVRVEDGRTGTTTQSFQIEIVSQASNSAPRVVSTPPLTGIVGRTYVYNMEAADPEGDLVSWSLSQAPPGMSIDALEGTLRWTPAADQTGPQDVVVQVKDIFLAGAEQSFTIDVRAVNSPPAIVSVPVVQASPNRLYVYAVRAVDSESDPLQFQLSAAPSGMSIDPKTGLVRWTPTDGQVGEHAVRIVVEDGQGGIDSQAYVITVALQAVNRPPVITSTPVYKAVTGRPYQYQVVASDPDGDLLQFMLDQKPAGAEIDQSTGLITWTPNAAQEADHVMTVVATDPAGGRGIQTFLLTVRPNRAPRIAQPPAQSIMAGRTYRYDLHADDPEGDPITWSLDSGPASMSIDADGRIAWKPIATDVGGYVIDVSARDSYGATDSRSFNLAVTADTEAPTVILAASTNLVDLHGEVTFYVWATDNVGVVSRTLTINRSPVAIDADNRAVVTMDSAGLFEFVASATDPSGNIGTSAPWQVRVLDPDDQEYPQVEIISPTMDQEVTYLTDVVATVQDDNLEFWRLDYARTDLVDLNYLGADDPDYVVLATGTNNVQNQKLATFDPTLLSNDGYVIRLYAQNTNGLANTHGVIVAVSGNAKLGNFHLEFTDLSIPLAGIPIQINRIYDTLEANTEGDFGYGWQLGLQDAKIRETVPEGQGFQVGTRVYLTTPDGRRVGFTFEPDYAGLALPFVPPEVLAAFTYWIPKFEADPGVYDKLEVYETEAAAPGSIYELLGGPYNPSRYKLTTRDGNVYEYDQYAGLQTVTDRNGNSLVFTDSGVVHSSGQSIQFVRDGRGRITEVVGPPQTDGEPPVSVAYQYDAAGDLIAFTNSEGDTTHYTYLTMPAHFLDTIVDSHGVKVFHAEFDGDGRLVGSTDALGGTIRQGFDVEAMTGTITDARGTVTELLYDERGNVMEKREPNPDDPAHPLLTTYEYRDARFPDRETKITDRRGVVEQREYDSTGNMVRMTRAAGTPRETTTLYTYNSAGDVTSLTAGDQPPTVFRYDAKSHMTAIVNAAGAVATAAYDDAGRQTSFTDFNGHTTTYEYEAEGCCGSPHLAKYPDGTFSEYFYDRYGNLLYEISTSTSLSLTEYDTLGHKISEQFGISPEAMVTRYVYDGDLLDYEIIVNPESPNETPATPVAQRKSRITDYEYDAAENLIRQIDAEGGVVEFRYDANGNRVLLQDPVGNVTTWVYDSLNRMTEERDPFYWVDYVAAHPARFAGLTGDSFLAEIVSANNEPSGASAALNRGAEHVRVYGYDGEGNQTKTIDRNGRRREFNYDPLNRLTEERWYDPDGTLVRTIVSTYDAHGSLLSISDPDSTYAYTYDVLNRVRTIDNAGTPDMPHVLLTYQYDAMGNVTSTSDNLGVTIRSEYDSRNRLVKRWWEGDGVDPARVDFFYNVLGNVSREDRYADLAGTNRVGYTDYTYDLAGRTKSIVHRDAVDAVLAEYHYHYDFGGMLDREDRAGDWHADYTHDRAGQLLAVDYSGADVIAEQVDESYRYDANGNRTESYLHGNGYRTGPANQLLTDGTFNYTYDGEGNMVTRIRIMAIDGEVNSTDYEYDFRNLMTRIVQYKKSASGEGTISHETSYRYDALGRRIQVVNDGEKTAWVFDGKALGGNEWAQFSGTGTVARRFLTKENIGQFIAQWTTGKGAEWLLSDQLDTMRGMTNNAGQIMRSIQYAAFGFPILAMPSSDPHQIAFTGCMWDGVIGMTFHRTRVYDAQVGRFSSQDQMRFNTRDANLYRYASNIPTLLRDPLGTDPIGEYSFVVTRVLTTAAMAYVGTVVGADLLTMGICMVLPNWQEAIALLLKLRKAVREPLDLFIDEMIGVLTPKDDRIFNMTCQQIHDAAWGILREIANR